MSIKVIAAIDSKRGIANDTVIPWNGKIPSDSKYYRQKIENGIAIYGRATYEDLSYPYKAVKNVVATRSKIENLREGFVQTDDARKFLEEAPSDLDVWVLGGAGVFESTFDFADELYLTQLQEDFDCTKFFPEYEDDFVMTQESDLVTENDISYTFQVWKRK